jgi:hypothetical protein
VSGHQTEPSALEREISRLWWLAACAGELGKAWEQSDRLIRSGQQRRDLPRYFRTVYDGTPLTGRPILVHCWRGLGDAIHFSRYLPLLRDWASQVFLDAPSPLLPLFASLPVDQLGPSDFLLGQTPPGTLEAEITELPYIFRTTLETVPSKVPYLVLPNDLPITEPGTGYRIGLCWSGGSYDARRALAPEDLVPLREIEGVRWFQLQRGRPVETLTFLPFENVAEQSMDLLLTARRVAGLDLVITVDTMIAHLAGALARPTWTLLQAEPDWRWFRERSDSPWYPTLRLFRQSKPGVWGDVVGQVREELQRLLDARR